MSNVSSRQGFTIAEVLVAFVLIVLVVGALEGNTLRTLQTFRDSNSTSIAARLVQSRAEILLAGPCTATSGTDSSGSVTAAWRSTPDGTLLHIDQTVRYPTVLGVYTTSFQTLGACP